VVRRRVLRGAKEKFKSLNGEATETRTRETASLWFWEKVQIAGLEKKSAESILARQRGHGKLCGLL